MFQQGRFTTCHRSECYSASSLKDKQRIVEGAIMSALVSFHALGYKYFIRLERFDKAVCGLSNTVGG